MLRGMSKERFYPIGTPGEPWTDDERAAWFASRTLESLLFGVRANDPLVYLLSALLI